MTPLSLCCAPRDFQYIGSAYVLYFSTLVYIVLILALCFLLNLNKLFADYDHNACKTYDPKYPCKDDWIHNFSIANYGLNFDFRGVVNKPHSVLQHDLPGIHVLHAGHLQKQTQQRAKGH